MARARDYSAEHQRRQAKARALGYQSYHHRRQTEQQARRYSGNSEREFLRLARTPPRGLTPAQVRKLWAEGDRAMRRGDFDEARKIARRLKYRQTPKGPPQRVFWYH